MREAKARVNLLLSDLHEMSEALQNTVRLAHMIKLLVWVGYGEYDDSTSMEASYPLRLALPYGLRQRRDH